MLSNFEEHVLSREQMRFIKGSSGPCGHENTYNCVISFAGTTNTSKGLGCGSSASHALGRCYAQHYKNGWSSNEFTCTCS